METQSHGSLIPLVMRTSVPPLPQITRLPALMTHVVLENIFAKLPVHDLKLCRLVCKTWNATSSSFLSKKSVTKLGRFVIGRPTNQDFRHYLARRIRVDENSEEDAKSFLNFIQHRDPTLVLQYRNFIFIACALTRIAGKLLRSPDLQSTITYIDIVIYVDQLEGLKQHIQLLSQLHEITISILNRSENSPEKIGEAFETESLSSNISGAHTDLGIRAITINIPTRDLRVVNHPPGQDEGSWRQAIFEPENLFYWLVCRTPKLEKICNMDYTPQFGLEGTIEQISREYRGNGLKSIGFGSRISKTATNKPTVALLQLLRVHCTATLETLKLYESWEEVDLKVLFASPVFPRDTLKTLHIKFNSKLKVSDCNWIVQDDIFLCTEKQFFEDESSNLNCGGDYLGIFPLSKPLHKLQNLSIIIQKDIAIPPEVEEPSLYLTNMRYIAQSHRVFPRVQDLFIRLEYQATPSGGFRVDIVKHLSNAFPALRKLRIHNSDPTLLNQLILKVSVKLESLEIEGLWSNLTITDEYFLDNEALPRLQALQVFSFKHRRYEFTDSLVYEGFLRLPLLQIVKFASSIQNKIDFTKHALEALKRHVDVYEKK